MRDCVLAEAREVVVDFQPRQLGAYTLMECRAHAGGLIQAAYGNRQQVSVAHIEAYSAPTRRTDHALTKTLPGLRDEVAAEQSERGSWDMNEREYRCSGLLTAPVAVAVAGIKNVGDLETYRIAGHPPRNRTPMAASIANASISRTPCRTFAGP
jgi:hypothetical protein